MFETKTSRAAHISAYFMRGMVILSLLQTHPLVSEARAADNCAERMVFAHYMVCCPVSGGGAAVDDYKEEIRTAQRHGIDGFVLNCGGWTAREPHYKQRCLQIYQAAQELNSGFRLFISADYCCGLTLDETRDMVETFRHHPNQFRCGNKPVLSTFGGGKHVTEFVRREFTGDRSIVFVPFYYPTPAAELPNQAQVDQVFNDNPSLDGFFHFGAAGLPDRLVESNRLLAQKWLAAGKIFMSPVTPFYRGLGGNYRVFECRGFEGMAKQWESAIVNNATWVQIVTWNDWGECSYVAPFGSPKETELWNGHWGKMLSHQGFLEASKYYIEWFKTGKRPRILKDEIFYFYRLHPKDILGQVRPGEERRALPAGAEWLVDNVFVTSFLRSPARLTIQSGATRTRFFLHAGVTHVSTPFSPGCQRFTLERKGRIILNKTGEHEISDTENWSNFNYFAGSASARVCDIPKPSRGEIHGRR